MTPLWIGFYTISFYLSYQDLKTYKVSDLWLFILVIFILVYSFYTKGISFIDILFPALVIFMIFWSIDHFKLGFVGGGDIKYLMIASIYLGSFLFVYLLIVAGVVMSITFLLWKKYKKSAEVPMIPSLTLSVLISDLLSYYKMIPLP